MSSPRHNRASQPSTTGRGGDTVAHRRSRTSATESSVWTSLPVRRERARTERQCGVDASRKPQEVDLGSLLIACNVPSDAPAQPPLAGTAFAISLTPTRRETSQARLENRAWPGGMKYGDDFPEIRGYPVVVGYPRISPSLQFQGIARAVPTPFPTGPRRYSHGERRKSRGGHRGSVGYDNHRGPVRAINERHRPTTGSTILPAIRPLGLRWGGECHLSACIRAPAGCPSGRPVQARSRRYRLLRARVPGERSSPQQP